MVDWVEDAVKQTEKKEVKVVKDFNSYFTDEANVTTVDLLYGDSSCGKTYVSQTYPEPIYIIDTENRALNTKKCNFPSKKIFVFNPVEYKTDFDLKDDDSLDMHKTIENIFKFIIDLANKVKKGEIDRGTVVLDSCTDIWQLCQEWGMYELAKYTNKDGGKKADVMMMRVAQQTDWRIINKRHKEIIGGLRALTKYGIHVVFTAKEEIVPEYITKTNAATSKDKIRAQKDLYFDADVVFNLKKVNTSAGTKFMAVCEKLSGKNPTVQPIENINYDKIKELLK